MAQTQTKKRSAPKRAKSSKPKSQSKTKKPKASKTAASKAKPKAKAASAKSSNAKPQSTNGARPKKAARKAALPLVAGGAAIAGAAGGMALAASKRARKSGIGKALTHRPKIKFDTGDVAKAAKEVGNFSAQVGELANELQRARESADGKKHRSPIEVVLQGLTARR